MDGNTHEGRGSGIEIDVVETLRRRWLQMIFGVVVGVGIAALYYKTTTPIYQSSLEILVGQRNSEVTSSGTISGGDASGDQIQDDQLATHLRLLISRKLLAQAVEIGDLRSLDSFAAAIDAGANPIDHLLGNIEVLRGGEGSARNAMVLRATYKDPDPQAAAVVLQAVYASYRRYVQSHGQDSTAEAVELMEEAREKHERELLAADQQYRTFVASVPALIDANGADDVHQDRLARLEKELNEVSSSLSEARSRLEVIDGYQRDHDGDAPGSLNYLSLLSQKEVERLKLFLDMTNGETRSAEFQAEAPVRQEVARVQYNKLLELVQKEQAMSDAFGEGHPLVEQVRKEIETTRTFITKNTPTVERPKTRRLDPAEMLRTYVSVLKNDIAEREKRRQILRRESAEEMRLAKRVEADFMKGSSLKAALGRAQTRYDEVIRRLQELKLSRSYAGFSTDLLAAPEVSRSPSWPRLPVVTLVGLLAGGMLGFTLALAAELFDSTFDGVDDLEATIGAPALAHVPRFNHRKIQRQAIKDSPIAPSIVTHHRPRSVESEVYRVARTALLMAARRSDVRTMVVTSPQPSDGKSTTIGNLAVALAQSGRRVILIDADMRRPVVADNFGVPSSPGLSDILSSSCAATEAIRPSGIANLDIIPAGSQTSSPAELLETQRLPRLLGALQKHYDLVLIDAPPILAVADPAIIAPLVDAVVLTVRIRKNGRRVVEQAIKTLKDQEIELTGVVVNGVDNDAKTYRYGEAGDGYGGSYIGKYHHQYAAADTDRSAPATRPAAKPAGPGLQSDPRVASATSPIGEPSRQVRPIVPGPRGPVATPPSQTIHV